MRRLSLGMQVFLSILGVTLGTVALVAIFARRSLSAAFDAYLATLPAGMGMQGRPRMGRMMLGAAEQGFIASVDRGVMGASFVAVAVAFAVALLLAAYLARPLKRLESAAEQLAEGDLAHRVEAEGPLEVAALGEAFNRMADSLETSEEMRRRLIADVAHELRNPLAAARGQAEGIADGVLVPDARRLSSLVEDLEHLSALVDDLQELAVAEAGRLRYDMREIDLGEIVRREVAGAEALARPGVAVRALIDGDSVARGDDRRLSQVVRNLLSNAVRYTSKGSVTARVSRGDDVVVVAVTDTGEGISADDLPRIFERFYRADEARASQTGGAGLGLAISRAIVRDHGGEVFADSAPGEGTTVGFRLPVAR